MRGFCSFFDLTAKSSNLLGTATSNPPNLDGIHLIESKTKYKSHKSHGVRAKNPSQNQHLPIFDRFLAIFWPLFWFNKTYICPVCIFWKQCKLAMFVPKFWTPSWNQIWPQLTPWGQLQPLEWRLCTCYFINVLPWFKHTRHISVQCAFSGNNASWQCLSPNFDTLLEPNLTPVDPLGSTLASRMEVTYTLFYQCLP